MMRLRLREWCQGLGLLTIFGRQTLGVGDLEVLRLSRMHQRLLGARKQFRRVPVGISPLRLLGEFELLLHVLETLLGRQKRWINLSD